jgi:epoxyqueuosine reductase
MSFAQREILPSKVNPREYLADMHSIFVIGVRSGRYYEFSKDYHLVVKDELAALCSALQDEFGLFKYKIHVDNGPLPERIIAVRAGLGFICRIECLISERFGSFFNIGLLITDLKIKNLPKAEFSTYKVVCDPRSSCRLCIAACKSGALSKNGYDYTKCVPYITQKKGALTDGEQAIIKGHVYSCDACRCACPYNAGKVYDTVTDEEAKRLTDEIRVMGKDEFNLKYKDTPLYWRGYETVKRNACI